MNERIELLDKQAVDYALSVCDANGVYQGKEYLAVVKEKFAELIVRECCDMVNKHMQRNNPNDYLLVLDIKEKFGIES